MVSTLYIKPTLEDATRKDPATLGARLNRVFDPC
jgi:hypothetical protein